MILWAHAFVLLQHCVATYDWQQVGPNPLLSNSIGGLQYGCAGNNAVFVFTDQGNWQMDGFKIESGVSQIADNLQQQDSAVNCVVIGTKLYTRGRQSPTSNVGMWTLDLTSNDPINSWQWEAIDADYIHYTQFALVGSTIWSFGGSPTWMVPNDETWKCTTSGSTVCATVSVTSSPAARYGHGTAALGTKLYVYSGFGSGGLLNDLWTLETTAGTLTWAQLAATATPGGRLFPIFAVASNQLVLAYGCENAYGSNPHSEVFTLAAGDTDFTLRTTTNNPGTRARPVGGAIGAFIYAGFGLSGTAGANNLYRLDIPALPGGGVGGDPHFQSFSGGVFDIKGNAGIIYNLISASWGQVNGEFVGPLLPNLREPNVTFLGRVCLVLPEFGHVVHYDPTTHDLHYAALVTDAENPLVLEDEDLELGKGANRAIFLRKRGQSYLVELPGLLISLRRKWQPKVLRHTTNLKSQLLRTSVIAHGLLGQTAHWTKPVPNTENGETLIDGVLADYEESKIYSTGSRFSYSALSTV